MRPDSVSLIHKLVHHYDEPFADMSAKSEHLALLEQWMKSYHPEELFDDQGGLRPELRAGLISFFETGEE